MSEQSLTDSQNSALEKLRSSDGKVMLPAAIGSKLVKLGLAVKSEETTGKRGFGYYKAA